MPASPCSWAYVASGVAIQAKASRLTKCFFNMVNLPESEYYLNGAFKDARGA